MTKALNCRPVRETDVEAVASFWNTRDPRINELYRWRNQAREHSGGNDAWIVTRGDDIVGAMNSVPFTAAIGGRIIRGAWQQDSLVIQEMRRKGLATWMIAEVAPEAILVCAKGSGTEMYMARLKAGFRNVSGSGYFVCPLRPWHKGTSFAHMLRVSLGFAWSWTRRRSATSDVEVQPGGEFTEAFDRLAERVSRLDVLTPVKRAVYLQWRYRHCPGCSYSVLQAADRHGVRAALILRDPPEGGSAGWIVDYLGDPGDSPALDALLEAARQQFYRAGAAFIWVFATSRRVRARLKRAGYIPRRLQPRFTYLFRRQGTFDPEAVEWNFYEGDGDVELYREVSQAT